MAQVAIREYDGKKMLASFLDREFVGCLVQDMSDWHKFESLQKQYPEYTRWVIKPDQLFGKRGKYGLIGVNLSASEVLDWYREKSGSHVTIGNLTGTLTSFLIEPFLPHTDEYYLAFKTEREHDILYFSRAGGIDIEENWDKVEEIKIPVLRHNTKIDSALLGGIFSENDSVLRDFVDRLYTFFVTYGFSYLEINPCILLKNSKNGSDEIVPLDFVARVDSCEEYKQKRHWEDIEFTNPFGVTKTAGELEIEELDRGTGASLKFRILNPDGGIWPLTSGGGASVILSDAIGDMGLVHTIGSYGECSGNPDRENTKAYTLVVLDNLIASKAPKKILLIAGAIANFTHIDKTFLGIIDALEERGSLLEKQNFQILVRRGGVNDVKGLQIMKDACERMNFPCVIADGNVYMTDILRSISPEEFPYV